MAIHTDVQFTAAEKAACALRELRLRTRVYPGLVRKGTMTQEDAERELELMRQIWQDYQEQQQLGLFGEG